MELERGKFMLFVEQIVLNIIYLSFPLLIYIIYVAYQKNLNHEEHSLFFEAALFTSLYFVIRYGSSMEKTCSTILFNIPLLLSYLKGRKITPLFISCILICYSVSVHHIPFLFVFFEYIIYYGVYVYMTRRKMTFSYLIHTFILMKSAILSFEVFAFSNPEGTFLSNFIHIFTSILTFYFVSYIIFYLLKKGGNIMDLTSTMKELEKEKKLRASLFKITHEIKNPIAVCKGYLDMLDLSNEEKVRKYIGIVKSEISRTLTLMDDYLDYTKINIVKEEADIYLLIEETLDSLESLFKKNEITTKFVIPDEELYMMVDYNRLKQVLVNVFKNSMEAKKEGRKMTIWLSTKKLKNQLVITIRDNGIGMDAESLERVSEMFYTTKQKGTGLGVSLSKEIIELHGGSMQYESTFGKGTKVTIRLPLS